MDTIMYERYKEDIIALLKENCCVVFNTHKNQYLHELAPPEMNFDHLSDLTESQKQYFYIAMHNDGAIPLFPKWGEEIATAFKINSLIGLAHILNNLLWNNQFNFCALLLIDDDQDIISFEPIVDKTDMEFIMELIDEFMEW